MRNAFLIVGCVVLAIVAVTATSRSEGEPEEPADPTEPVPEPITGVPIDPAPGDETPMRDPFTPYGTGSAGANWRYEDLTAEEKTVVDHGRNQPGWDSIQDEYAQAAMERATAAAAESAARQLGAGGLGTMGVVP